MRGNAKTVRVMPSVGNQVASVNFPVSLVPKHPGIGIPSPREMTVIPRIETTAIGVVITMSADVVDVSCTYTREIKRRTKPEEERQDGYYVAC